MPSSPEFGGSRRKKRLAEVLCQPDSEHLGTSPCDIDASVKIHINLEGVDQHAQDYDDPAVILVIFEDLPDIPVEPVGENHLLDQSPHDQLGTETEFLIVEPVFRLKFRSQLLITRDRSLRDHRKEDQEQEESENVSFGRAPFP